MFQITRCDGVIWLLVVIDAASRTYMSVRFRGEMSSAQILSLVGSLEVLLTPIQVITDIAEGRLISLLIDM